MGFKIWTILLATLLATLIPVEAEPCNWDDVKLQADAPSDVRAIVLAIEDEIYDLGYYRKFAYIGGAGGGIDEPIDVPLFIKISDHGDIKEGDVMYKLMPIGEVWRRYAFRKDGVVVLYGNPQNGFPSSQPDTNTFYRADRVVSEFKCDALKTYFAVDPNPTVGRLKAAAARQNARVGFSEYEWRLKRSVTKKRKK